jgi:hypothetical protein
MHAAHHPIFHPCCVCTLAQYAYPTIPLPVFFKSVSVKNSQIPSPKISTDLIMSLMYVSVVGEAILQGSYEHGSLTEGIFKPNSSAKDSRSLQLLLPLTLLRK